LRVIKKSRGPVDGAAVDERGEHINYYQPQFLQLSISTIVDGAAVDPAISVNYDQFLLITINYQSMVQQLMREGNMRHRLLNASPTGEH